MSCTFTQICTDLKIVWEEVESLRLVAVCKCDVLCSVSNIIVKYNESEYFYVSWMFLERIKRIFSPLWKLKCFQWNHFWISTMYFPLSSNKKGNWLGILFIRPRFSPILLTNKIEKLKDIEEDGKVKAAEVEDEILLRKNNVLIITR